MDQATPVQLENATLCLMNKEREKYGSKPLRSQVQLRDSAHRHTQDMLENHHFSHRGSDNSTVTDRVRRTGYMTGTRKWWVGENIAYGLGPPSAPREIMTMLMHSHEHRRNILNGRFREVGVVVEPGSPDATHSAAGATYTADFGARR